MLEFHSTVALRTASAHLRLVAQYAQGLQSTPTTVEKPFYPAAQILPLPPASADHPDSGPSPVIYYERVPRVRDVTLPDSLLLAPER